MSRFLEPFYGYSMIALVNRINEYAKEHNLEIISLSATDNLCGAIVLFEDKVAVYAENNGGEIR